MLFNSLITSIALMASLVAAAPTNITTKGSENFQDYGPPLVKVINNCKSTLKIGHSVDVDYYGPVIDVPVGGSHTYKLPINWSGRIWGRTNCGGQNCYKTGMGSSPASLAEFHFLESGKVFYDISFVAGFNLPIVVEPVKKVSIDFADDRLCRTSRCTTLPDCPAGFETYDDNGKISGCLSACTKFNTDEYCCTGHYLDPKICTTNSYASAVEAVCPDVYSYAFDDDTSVYMCTSNAYTVTYC
jgi:hypothetical protein